VTDNPANEERIRAIDLFCGIGGNSWGARNAGVEIIAGFDKWELAGEVYKDNFPKAKFFPSKLQDIKLQQVKKEIGKIDLILASPECTSHSVARGDRTRHKRSMQLAFQITRFSKSLKPRWILVENVIQMKRWERYKNFIEELESQGYKVKEEELVASDFGVPQSRNRLYLLCDRLKTPPQIVPPEIVEKKNARDIVNLNGVYQTSPLDNGCRAQKTLARAECAIQAVGKYTSFLMVYYGSDGEGSRGWQSLDIPLRTITTLDRFALVKPGENGGGPVMRMLQPPELQAAMGFHETFKLERGNRRNKIHLLGNAVCPPVIEAILETLIGKELLEASERVRDRNPM
jgi:DNA (cytosine-5)-methyltransferase 1